MSWFLRVIELASDSVIPVLGIYPGEMKIKRNEVLRHATAWMLSEKNQSHMVPFIYNVQRRQVCREVLVVAKGEVWGRLKKWGVTANGPSFGVVKYSTVEYGN